MSTEHLYLCAAHINYRDDCPTCRLNKAAPQLLEACKAALEWAKTPCNHGGNPYAHKFMGLVEAALAAAEVKE